MDSGDEACAGIEPITLSEGSQVTGLAVGALMLRQALNQHRLGLGHADDGCPHTSGDEETEPEGARTWRGDCGREPAFDGALTRTWTAVNETWTGEGWSVTGASGLETLTLDGTWFASEATSGGETARVEVLEGSLRFATGDGQPPELAFPLGVTGDYAFEGVWGPDAQRHAVFADLAVPCRGSVFLDLEVLESEDGCASGLPDGGRFEITAQDHTAVVDLNVPEACQGCWAWTLDGADQGLVCL